MIIDKEGNEYHPMEISDIPIKNDGDIWIAKHRDSDFPEVIELEHCNITKEWKIIQMGMDHWSEPENFLFLKQIKLPKIIQELT